jgi:hypothetical protein
LFLTGCSPTYNITPDYNKKNKTIFIDDYKIDFVSYHTSKNTLKDIGLNVQSTYKQFSSEDKQCKKIAYVSKSIGTNGYYHTSAIDDTLRKYKNRCEVEQIGNINFFRCIAKYKVNKDSKKFETKNLHYGATTSSSNQYGYSDKLIVYMGNDKNCFEDIKKHFKKKTKKEYINITKSIDFNKNIKFYTGTFKAIDNHVACAKNGNIELYLDNDSVKGNISFKRNEKNHLSKNSWKNYK